MVLNHIIRHNHYLNEIETETETKEEGQKKTGDSKNKNTTQKKHFSAINKQLFTYLHSACGRSNSIKLAHIFAVE